MQIPEFEGGEFANLVRAKEFKKALQTVFGVGDKPVEYACAFLKKLEELTPQEYQDLLAWCKTPMEPQPISDFRWYVDQIARHEIGHAVVARILGFQTGEIALRLLASNGNHVATATTPLHIATPNLVDVENYIERRVIILMAGTMSEPDSVEHLKYGFQEGWDSESAKSDRQKSEELVQVLVNIRGLTDPRVNMRCIQKLTAKTLGIVHKHFNLIDRIAKTLSAKVTHFGQLATLSAEELDGMLELEALDA